VTTELHTSNLYSKTDQIAPDLPTSLLSGSHSKQHTCITMFQSYHYTYSRLNIQYAHNTLENKVTICSTVNNDICLLLLAARRCYIISLASGHASTFADLERTASARMQLAKPMTSATLARMLSW
jgi:hypothetical protein